MDKESDKFERGLFYGILTISIIVVIFNFYVFLIPMKTTMAIVILKPTTGFLRTMFTKLIFKLG